ncbi:MAG: hypothetical protein IJW38_00755 [Clostridia bacterium]|nr:hypothetical protein [Clostridia bacterium]
MATDKKRRINWKSIISVVLVIGAVIGIGAGVSAIAKDETKTLSSIGTFTRGSLDEKTGKFVKGDTSIVTEELIECAGLTVTPEFDSNVQYQIFWYNMDEIYFTCTELSDGVFSGNIPECAKYSRIVIVPELNTDDKDVKINFWEIPGIAKNLKIEVSKDQSVLPVDYYQEAYLKKASKDYVVMSISENYEFYEYKYFNDINGDGKTSFVDGLVSYEENHSVVKLNCSDVSQFKFTFNEKDFVHEVFLTYFDVSGNQLISFRITGNPGASSIIEVPEGSAYIVFNVAEIEKPIVINKYLPR